MNNPPFKAVDRIIVSSQREIVTIEYPNEPDVFYVFGANRSMSGPFSVEDERFKVKE